MAGAKHTQRFVSDAGCGLGSPLNYNSEIGATNRALEPLEIIINFEVQRSVTMRTRISYWYKVPRYVIRRPRRVCHFQGSSKFALVDLFTWFLRFSSHERRPYCKELGSCHRHHRRLNNVLQPQVSYLDDLNQPGRLFLRGRVLQPLFAA